MTRVRPLAVLRGGLSLAVPQAVFYGLRAVDVAARPALVTATLLTVVPGLVQLVRERVVSLLSVFFSVMTVGSLLVSVVSGDARALLAREAALTGVTGLWFLAGAVARRPPLVVAFCRPLLEGRLRWPDDWDALWQRSPRWRRMWRTLSVLYGVGTLLDAVLRVVLAYTQPVDRVPALSTLLFAATSLVLVVLFNVTALAYRVQDPRSALRREAAVAV